MVLSSSRGEQQAERLGMVPWDHRWPRILASASRCLPCRADEHVHQSSISVATGLSNRAASYRREAGTLTHVLSW